MQLDTPLAAHVLLVIYMCAYTLLHVPAAVGIALCEDAKIVSGERRDSKL